MATSVRFPLPASVFPPMKVQSDQAMQFSATCERIVESTLLARREYVDRYQRRLDPASWELVKRRATETADLAVYKPHRGTAAAIPAASVNASPILIGTGSLEGSLDEVMLGLTATNTSAMRFVTSTMYKDVADSRVLTRIDTPNDSDPFAFLGFKWVVKVPSKRLVPLARARDFVFLESTGVRHLDDNETSGPRVGYQLMHSVDLSCCPALPIEFGVVRGYISFCLLFVECGNNRVDVFCKGFVDPRGGLSRRLTIRVAADVIMDCQHAVACAQRKKIEWTRKEVAQATQEQRHSSDARLSGSSSSSGVARGDADQPDCEAILCASYGQESGRRTMGTEDEDASPLLAAGNCIHCRSGRRRRSTVTGWGHAAMCGICSDRVCSRCSRQVTLPGAASATETTTCCMGCLERAETMDAAGFARELAQRAMAFQPPPYRFTQTGWASPGHKLRLAPIQKRPERRYTFALVD